MYIDLYVSLCFGLSLSVDKTKQETSAQDVSQNTTAGDEASSRTETSQGGELLKMSEPKASGSEEIAAEDAKETETELGDGDGQRVSSQLKEQTQEEKIDTFQEKELSSLPEYAENSVQNDADEETSCSEQTCAEREMGEQDAAQTEKDTLCDQHDASTSCEEKSQKSGEQGQGHGQGQGEGHAEENVEESEKDIQPELTDEPQTMSRL